MSHLIIEAPHIQRKATTDRSAGNGSHMVDNGIVAFQSSTGIAMIFERSNFEERMHVAQRKMRINL